MVSHYFKCSVISSVVCGPKYQGFSQPAAENLEYPETLKSNSPVVSSADDTRKSISIFSPSFFTFVPDAFAQ